jgi:hypothetical protein
VLAPEYVVHVLVPAEHGIDIFVTFCFHKEVLLVCSYILPIQVLILDQGGMMQVLILDQGRMMQQFAWGLREGGRGGGLV